MKNKIFLCISPVLVFFVYLCVAYMWMFSSAYAASALPETGRSGGCTWKYEQIDGDTVLTIAPTEGTDGTLSSFSWCSSWRKKTVKRVVVKGTVKVGSSADSMFEDFRQAKSMDLSGLDVTGMTSTRKMFYGCSALTSLDVSTWNVSSVISAWCMFYGCCALTSLDVSNWNVSNMLYTVKMFFGCRALTSLDVHAWNVSNVTSTEFMFSDCQVLSSLDVSNWNVSKVTNMGFMFFGCRALTSLDVSNWNVAKVAYMGGMFGGCGSLTTLDVSVWNVSNVTSMGRMFDGCSALTSLVVSAWNVSRVTNMMIMFSGCEALATLDVSAWNVSRVTNMWYMFGGCSALTSLDMSRWKVTNKVQLKDKFGETGMHKMFAGMQSLKQIFLGSNFYIEDDAGFGDAGSQVGTKWMQVNLSEGGTHRNPKGKVFDLPSDLLAFHREKIKRGTGVEEYMRVAPAKLMVTFSKGADDATGTMALQAYDASTTKALSKNAYKRVGHAFSGWKDPKGKIYTGEQAFENNYFGQAAQNGEALERTLELVAQWRAILTYKAKEGTRITLSRTQEELDQNCNPLGSGLAIRVPRDKEVVWTIQEGGTDAASFWSHKGAKLGGDEIKAAAQKDGAFVPTTFVAEFVGKTYTITFDAGAPSGTKVEGLPSPIVVKYGQDARIPTGITLSRSGYQFAGTWNDDKNGEGAFYRAGGKIRNVFSHMTLHAQWRVILAYKVKEGTRISLLRAQEEFDSSCDPSCDPLGTEVTSGVPEDKEVMWTVQKGEGDDVSEWSYKGDVLEKNEIEKAALKDGKFVPTTFVAELVDKFHTITFDVNAPEGTVVLGRIPNPIIVRHSQMAWIPFGIVLSCSNYTFTGEWNDNKGGRGASYRAGSKIKNVFSCITLYAQWESTATFVSEVKAGKR